MIIEKILIVGVKGSEKWIKTANQMREIVISKKWDKPNTLKIYSHENVDAVIERGKNSSVKPELPIGSLVDTPYIEGKTVYFDNPYWTPLFGNSCVFNNDCKPFQLFCSGKKDKIHPTYTEGMLITKLAMKKVFEKLNIPIEFFTDADVYLLPSRDKFACGWSRAMYKNGNKKQLKYKNGEIDESQFDMVRTEGGWISFYIDHDLFQQILPPNEYNREGSHDPNHAGLDGIENKYPYFDREDFLTLWTLEVSKILNDPITEVKNIILK